MSILFVVFALCFGTAFLTFNLISIMQGDLAAVEKTIDAGMDVNLVHNNRTTPLIYAIYGSNVDMVKLLISKGADGTFYGSNPLNLIILSDFNPLNG